ncbi:MAG: hypothetical protein C0600_15705 [Ignavibacteria bacterium]|nr:MAG: hypothetical protein C0600_15705 [Ignavibacteria bacterium]
MITRVGYAQHFRELSNIAQGLHTTERTKAMQLQSWILQRLNKVSKGVKDGFPPLAYAISLEQIDSLAQAIGMLAQQDGRNRELEIEAFEIGLRTRDGTEFPAIRAMDYYTKRQYDSAIVHFDRALQEGFHTPGLYLLYGNALALSQRYSESLSRFEEGVRRYPDDGMLRFTLGKYYVRARIQPERAAELLQWCIENENPREKVEAAQKLLYSLVR